MPVHYRLKALVSVPSHPCSLAHYSCNPCSSCSFSWHPVYVTYWVSLLGSALFRQGWVEEEGAWLGGWNGETLPQQTRTETQACDGDKPTSSSSCFFSTSSCAFFFCIHTLREAPDLFWDVFLSGKSSWGFKCRGKIWALRGVKHHLG